MTHNDYILIAAAIKATRDNLVELLSLHAIDCTSHTIASKLQSDNALFDRNRFLKAAGHQEYQT